MNFIAFEQLYRYGLETIKVDSSSTEFKFKTAEDGIKLIDEQYVDYVDGKKLFNQKFIDLIKTEMDDFVQLITQQENKFKHYNDPDLPFYEYVFIFHSLKGLSHLISMIMIPLEDQYPYCNQECNIFKDCYNYLANVSNEISSYTRVGLNAISYLE